MSDYQESVRVASTANINLLVMPATIDGITMARNDRFLAKNQTAGAENGIYIWKVLGERARRAAEVDNSVEMNAGMMVPVEEGAANMDILFTLTTDNPIKVGTTVLTFTAI